MTTVTLAWQRACDVVRDVVLELTARRPRTVLMLLAVAMSTGALIASVAISGIATKQIDADLAASTIDEITVSVKRVSEEDQGNDAPKPSEAQGQTEEVEEVSTVFPHDAESRVEKLTLVVATGIRLNTEHTATRDSSQLSRSGGNDDEAQIEVPVAAATSGYLAASLTRLDVPGRAWLLDDEDNSVVFLGKKAAKQLGIPISYNPSGHQVWIDGRTYQVAGFFADSGRSGFSETAVIPYHRALVLQGNDNLAQMLVRTAPGAGTPVAGVIREAIRPDAPLKLESSQVVSVNSLRRGVETQMDRLVAGIGLFLLALTALLIANSMIVSVVARTAEIGVRRALGASQSSVASVFLTEGAIVGTLGGLAGAAMALAVVVGISAVNQWTFTINPLLVITGPFLGGMVGVVSSVYPAIRAARIHPALAVRAD